LHDQQGTRIAQPPVNAQSPPKAVSKNKRGNYKRNMSNKFDYIGQITFALVIPKAGISTQERQYKIGVS
jgi:hypothetical protein